MNNSASINKQWRFIYLLLAFQCTLLAYAGEKPTVTKWIAKDPFEQKAFVENKGQFTSADLPAKNQTILFSARQDGLHYFFTKDAIYIKRITVIKRTEKEIEHLIEHLGIKEEGDGKDEKEFAYKLVDQWHCMQFDRVGSSTIIIPQDKIKQVFTYGSTPGNSVSAHAYKKITYKNLYPGIDMEFYFPEDKQGFKYTFIVHPGADPSVISIQYPLEKATELSSEGNVKIQSVFGTFVDHAPIANEEGNTTSVPCSFDLKRKNIEFSLGTYDHAKNLVIDPWTTTPTFTGGNSAYDVDWDFAGNCYAYGGGWPCQLIKFGPSGTPLWSYTNTFCTNGSNGANYGDFAVDRKSQSVYITEGAYYLGARVCKLGQTGTVMAAFAGNNKFAEMWRITFNRCTNQALISGSGFANPSSQASTLDTNLVNLNMVNFLTTDPCHDIWGLTLDNYGNAYMLTTHSICGQGNIADNILLKVPMPSLTPMTWQVPTGYNVVEASSITYLSGIPLANGFNGIATSATNVYTYDSYDLKKWTQANGSQTGSASINGPAQQSMYYGGLTADDCDHVFLGSGMTIKQYDGNSMSLVNSIPQPDTIYDVMLNSNGNTSLLYSCGQGFVSVTQLTLPTHCYWAQHQITNGNCTNPIGSATVTVTGGVPPYTITWSNGQTGPILSSVPSGTYIATITDNSCSKVPIYDTVIINYPGALTVTASQAAICNGSSTTLSVNAGSAYTYSWSPGSGLSATTGSVVTANPSTTTIYTVVGTASSCTATATFTVTVNPLPQITVTSATVCPSVTATITASGATTYTWNTGATSSSFTTAPVSNTIYTVTGTDANGCSVTATATVSINSPIIIIASATSPLCAGQTLNLSGSAASTYTWSGPGGFTSSQQNPTVQSITITSAGTYTLIATDTNGCKGIDTAFVLIKPVPVVSVSPAEYCPGVSTLPTIFSSNPGGTTASFYWTNLNTGIGLGASGSGNIPSFTTINTTNGSVTAIVLVHASYNGCTGPDSSFTITIDTDPRAGFSFQYKICQGSAMQFSDLSSSGVSQWNWDMNNDGIFTDATTQNPSYTFNSAGSHTVVLAVKTSAGCEDTINRVVYVNPLPQAAFVADNTKGCAGLNANFTDQSVITAPAHIQSWSWNFGNSVFNGQYPPTISYGSTSPVQMTSYTVSLTVTSDSGCTSIVTKPNYITVYPKPVADFNYTSNVNETDGIDPTVHFFDASSGASSVHWDLGDVFLNPYALNFTNMLNPVHAYNHDDEYSYNVTEWVINSYGCKDSITKKIDIKPGFTFYAPNAFSPNSDGTNDGFKGTGVGIDNATYRLLIFDRWGNQIFESHDLEKTWDGRVNNSEDVVQEDVYVWKADFKDFSGRKHEYKGTVSLIK